MGEFLAVENAPSFGRAQAEAEAAVSDRSGTALGAYLPALNLFVRAALAAEPAFPARSLDDDVLMVGHSLVDPIPGPLRRFVAAAGGRGEIRRATIPGAPLEWNWENLPEERAALARGGTEVLVITERVPVDAVIQYHDAKGYALRWHDLAVAADPAAQTFLYETWTDLRSGTDRRDEEGVRGDTDKDVSWRGRLDLDVPRWRSIADHVNANRAGGPEMRIIPAGQALARLHDEIARGGVPGVDDVRAFFLDDIHLNDRGAYFVAAVHYAALYGLSPVGLPSRVPDLDPLPPELALRLQEIAWEAVVDHREATAGPAP